MTQPPKKKPAHISDLDIFLIIPFLLFLYINCET